MRANDAIRSHRPLTAAVAAIEPKLLDRISEGDEEELKRAFEIFQYAMGYISAKSCRLSDAEREEILTALREAVGG